MKHITIPEIILYQKELGLSIEERRIIENHIEECKQCHGKYTHISNELTEMLEHNIKECEYFLSNIQSYLNGHLSSDTKRNIENHLNDCDSCQQLCQWIKDIPAWDTTKEIDIDVPMKFRNKIERNVLESFPQNRNKDKKIYNYIHDIELMFRPIRPAFAFRGNPDDEMKVIEHSGGDICLRTHLKNTTIELTNIFEEFTLKAVTDDKGIVIFKDVSKGDYVVNVKGYELIDIKIKK